jgi:hypothetical protein
MYCLVQDNDAHWYVIPVQNREEWYDWLEQDPYEASEQPEWAVSVGGSPNLVEFHNYTIA